MPERDIRGEFLLPHAERALKQLVNPLALPLADRLRDWCRANGVEPKIAAQALVVTSSRLVAEHCIENDCDMHDAALGIELLRDIMIASARVRMTS